MNNNSNNYDNKMNIDSSSSILVAEAVLCTPTQKHQPGTLSALYKLAARNLREYHGVPSMTALKLEKTVALLGLRPRRIVVQGLAPRRLLRGGKGGSSPLVFAGEVSDEGKEELREAETGAMMDDNLINNTNNNNNSSDAEDREEDEEEVGQEDILVSDDSSSSYDDNGDNIDSIGGDTKGDAKADGNGNGKTRRPIHAALVAGGINLRPRETGPLLRALGVRPQRLVKLGLVTREAVRAMPGRGGGGPGHHLRAGGPRQAGVGGSRGPPHAHGCGPSSGCGPSRPMHGPHRRHLHRAGRHFKHVPEGERDEEEGMSSSVGPGPHGSPGHRGPRHRGERQQGPSHGRGHHSMPIVKHGPGHGCGPPGSGELERGHCHPLHGHKHGHRHGGGAGGECLHGGAHGPAGQEGPRRHGGGSMGRPLGHGRAQGPPHGPPHGPFDEGASGAPPGMMAHPHHGSPSRVGGGGMRQRGGRHGGGMGNCGGRGGGGGGGGEMKLWWRAHLAQFDDRHQPLLGAH